MADDMTTVENAAGSGVVNALNASIGLDFSLIGSRLHAAYEKNGSDGYAVLLIPSEQNADNGVSIGEVVEDIKKLVKGVDEKADTSSMEKDLESGISGLSQEKGKGSVLDKLIIKLKMAYLYIRKSSQESMLEYAFQLEVITGGMIPEGINQLVDVDHISISVWNTNRRKVVEKMGLMTIHDYLEMEEAVPQIPEQPEQPEDEPGDRPEQKED